MNERMIIRRGVIRAVTLYERHEMGAGAAFPASICVLPDRSFYGVVGWSGVDTVDGRHVEYIDVLIEEMPLPLLRRGNVGSIIVGRINDIDGVTAGRNEERAIVAYGIATTDLPPGVYACGMDLQVDVHDTRIEEATS